MSYHGGHRRKQPRGESVTSRTLKVRVILEAENFDRHEYYESPEQKLRKNITHYGEVVCVFSWLMRLSSPWVHPFARHNSGPCTRAASPCCPDWRAFPCQCTYNHRRLSDRVSSRSSRIEHSTHESSVSQSSLTRSPTMPHCFACAMTVLPPKAQARRLGNRYSKTSGKDSKRSWTSRPGERHGFVYVSLLLIGLRAIGVPDTSFIVGVEERSGCETVLVRFDCTLAD